MLRYAGKMAEDLQNPTWKYCVIPNRDGESTFWQQRQQKKKKNDISALCNSDETTIGLDIGTMEDNVHGACMLSGEKKDKLLEWNS